MKTYRLLILLFVAHCFYIPAYAQSQGEEATRLAEQDIKEIMPLVLEKRYDEALQLLTQKQDDDWLSDGDGVLRRYYQYSIRLWSEAQTKSGRDDPDWSWRLFAWLSESFRKTGSINLEMGALHNVTSGLWETARMGLYRKYTQIIRQRLQYYYGIQWNFIEPETFDFDDFEFPDTKFPLKYTQKMREDANINRKLQGWINQTEMSAISICAEDCLVSGKWLEALYLYEWMGQWAEALLDAPQMPHFTDREGVMSILDNCLRAKASIYWRLGFEDKAYDFYDQIIANNNVAYKKREVDKARTNQIVLLAEAGKADSQLLQELEELEERRRNNKFEFGPSGEETRLAKVQVLHALGSKDEAYLLLADILDIAEKQDLPTLEYSALETFITLSNKDELTEGVREALFKALTMARRNGMIHNEPELYTAYAEHLFLTKHYHECLKMQQRAVELYRAIKLKPKEKEALAVLDKLQAYEFDTFAASPVDNKNNPYYSTALAQHKIETREPLLAIRAIASKPTRIEAYDSKDNLLFVDAEGNGNFTDPGDVLYSGFNDNSEPLLTQSQANSSIQLRYLSYADSSEPIAIEIQVAKAGDTSASSWKVEQTDRI